jgi:UDP-N-acetylmuramyl pentapeptide phosphotransferase/UDP-N-acetylglucosamine-1-phosphate transferase
MSTILTAVGSSTLLLFAGSTLLAFLLAVAATPIVGALARRFGLMDIPGGRRRHPEPIPRIGGLGIAVAFGLAIFAFWLVDRLTGHPFLIPVEVRTPRLRLAGASDELVERLVPLVRGAAHGTGGPAAAGGATLLQNHRHRTR